MERIRIARELHDTIVQGLTGLSLHLEGAITSPDDPQRARESPQAAKKLTRNSLTEIKGVRRDLRPEELQGRYVLMDGWSRATTVCSRQTTNQQGDWMKRLLFRVLCCVALITGAATSLPAQTTTFVSPVPFYRFRVSDTNLGYLYTASFQEGANAGFTPDGALHNSNGVIGFVVVPPTQDSTPVAGQGLVPLHRLRVIESGRAYWYLTTTLGSYGSNYTYEGIAGYALNLSDSRPGFTLTAYYSQSYGYWFSVGERVPDAQYFSPYGYPPPGDCPFVYYDFSNGLYYCSTYNNHGSIAKLMWDQSGRFEFTTPAPPPPPPPPPPPGSCTAGDGIKAKCGQLGGTWSDETCSCEY